MSEEELKQAHAEDTAPKSDEQTAHELLSAPDSVLLDNKRSVLVKVLEINGINHDSLNMSRSKFSKLSKPDLVKALRGTLKSDENAKEEKTEGQGQGERVNPLEVLSFGFELAKKAFETKDYSNLDRAVADSVFRAVQSDDELGEAVSIKPATFAKIALGFGVVYVAARVVGIDTIKDKAQGLFKPKKKQEAKGAESEQ